MSTMHPAPAVVNIAAGDTDGLYPWRGILVPIQVDSWSGGPGLAPGTQVAVFPDLAIPDPETWAEEHDEAPTTEAAIAFARANRREIKAAVAEDLDDARRAEW